MMLRRTFLTGTASAAIFRPRIGRAAATPEPDEVRIGFQKSSLLAIAKQQRLVEAHIKATWAEFSHGPPLLEALGAGRLDYGYAGNAPPIFAQAAKANIVYVAAQPAHGDNVGIVVPDASSVRSVADLRGKKIAVAKGSSAHDLLVAALESVDLAYGDITPVYLAPADAVAAFAAGAVDAWSIWDPFLAIVQTSRKARRLDTKAGVGQQNAFFLANRTFLATYPQLVAALNADVAAAARYARAHRDEAVALFAAATGVPLEAETLAVSRTDFTVVPISEVMVRQQQAVADRFARLRLIPEKIEVAKNVWSWR